MALKKLSLNDELGEASSHFFKSGNIMRNKEADELVFLRHLLPKKGTKNTKIEYDVSYDMGGKTEIHGYTYTDCLNKFIYLRVANDYFRNLAMIESIEKQVITDEGEKIYKDISENNSDKYRLKKIKENYNFVIFLPGSNIYSTVVDESKIKKMVDNEGAKIKCHPITPSTMYSTLKNNFGADNIIDKKYSGHELLEKCSKMGFCYNSEMGIVAITKNKELYHIGQQKEKLTYSSIYKALFDTWEIGYFGKNDNVETRLKCILSADFNGLISKLSKDPKQKINNFFNFYKGYKHVPPKNTHTGE